MVKKWSEVAADPQFATLSDDDKDALRDRYFNNVVASAAPADQVEPLRARFDEATNYGRRGRSTQAGPTADEMRAAPTPTPTTTEPNGMPVARRGTLRAVAPFVAADNEPPPESAPGLAQAQPWGRPQARRGTMRAAQPFVGGDTMAAPAPPEPSQASVLDRGAKTAPDDAMPNPSYVAQLREDFGALPEHERLPQLRDLAQTDTIQGRAARALLAQVERENARGPNAVQDEALAAQVLAVGRGNQPQAGTDTSANQKVRFPDITPSFGDVMEGTSPQAIAARRSLATGLGEETSRQKVEGWAADARAAGAEAKKQKAVRDAQPSFVEDPMFHLVDTIRDSQAGLRQIGPLAAKTAWDLLRMGADATNAKDFAAIAKGASENGSEVIHSLDNPNGDHNVQGAFASLGTALLGAGFAGEAGALLLGSAQAGGDKYSEARNAGFSTGDAAQAMAAYTVAEYLGEKISLPSLGRLAFQRVLKNGLSPKDAVHSALRKFVKEGLIQQSGEQLTQAMESLYDKFGPAGGKPNLTFDEYLNDAIDVVKQTAIMSAVAGGAGHVGKKAQERAVRIGLQDAMEARAHAQATAATMDEQQLRNTYEAGRQPTAYDIAARAGFHVDPPLKTESPAVRRSKTIAIFENLAAEYGMDQDAVQRATKAAAGMPAADVGPFLDRMAKALQTRGLVAQPIEQHAADTLTAGPVEDPKVIDAKIKELAKANQETRGSDVSRETITVEQPSEPSEAKPADLTSPNEPGEPVHHILPSDLQTADQMPYGTRAGAQARATREGEGELVRVNGGWVVRTEPTMSAAEGPSATTKEASHESQVDEGRQQARREDGTAQEGAPGSQDRNRQGAQENPGQEGQAGVLTRLNEPAQSDLRQLAAEPAGSAAGGRGEPAGSSGTVGRVAADTGRVGAAPAGAPVVGGGAAEPVRGNAPNAGAVGPRVIAHVGTMPNSATPLELRANKDGTLTPWNGGREVLDFESGVPVSVPADSTDAKALAAVKQSGAFGRRTKYFQPPGAKHAAQEVSQPANVQSEHQGRDQGGKTAEAGGGDRVQRAADGKSTAPEERPVASWVIKNKATGDVVAETFEKKTVDALNTGKYEAVPIAKHLAGLSRAETKAEPAPQPAEPPPPNKPPATAAAAAEPEPKKPRALTNAEVFANNHAAFSGRTVTRSIPVQGGGTATLKLDAQKAMRGLDARLKALESLKACIGARA